MVGVDPFQAEVYGSCFFHKQRGGSRSAKISTVEDVKISRVVPGQDYSCTTISGSSCRPASQCKLFTGWLRGGWFDGTFRLSAVGLRVTVCLLEMSLNFQEHSSVSRGDGIWEPVY